jgi:uncharacterized protein
MSLVDQILYVNEHWLGDLRCPIFKRRYFSKILEQLEKKEIITLIGPRRVGKTTLLKQIIQHLIQEKDVPTNHILLFSFDLYQSSLLEIINQYSQIQGVDYKKEKIYILLDEIQYLENWASQVKFLWDHQNNLHIILSGSSSSDLLRGRESLAGREVILTIDPLSFDEYLDLTDQQTSIDLVRYRLYMEYMDRQLPQLALDSGNSKKHITELVDKVINYDIARLYNISDTQIIYSIFKIICKSPGEIIKYEDLATMFEVNAQTIKIYFKYLEDALLIRKLYNYQTNARKSERSKKRFYPYFTTLHIFAFPHTIEFGRKIETEVAFQLKPQFFWNRLNQEIDFILNLEEITAIEVKTRKNIRKNDLKWLLKETFCKKKYVITNYEYKLNFEIEGLNVDFIPMHKVSKIIKP